MTDPVNHPSHYGSGSIECIDYIEDMLTREEFIGYLRGNIAKYLHRWRYKGRPVEDLQKAQWYLARLEKLEKGKQEDFSEVLSENHPALKEANYG